LRIISRRDKQPVFNATNAIFKRLSFRGLVLRRAADAEAQREAQSENKMTRM
jgi:hypothetical protein